MKIKTKCDWCGQIIYKFLCEMNRHQHHFCNTECFCKYFHKHGHNGKKIIICRQCSKQKIVCKASQRQFCSKKCWIKWMNINWKGALNPHYGKKWSKNSRFNMSKNWHKVTKRVEHLNNLNKNKKRHGEHNPNWLNGISFEPYGSEFNVSLKEFIRKRDWYRCQNEECDVPESECSSNLTTHHIDYCKRNNDYINLIALCKSCNAKANYNRKYWQTYYENIQIKRRVHTLEKYVT